MKNTVKRIFVFVFKDIKLKVEENRIRDISNKVVKAEKQMGKKKMTQQSPKNRILSRFGES